MPARILGILGYQPAFQKSISEVLQIHQSKLRSLIDQPIKESWIVWNRVANKWLSDCPIILCIGDQQLEICTPKLGELSITWNSVNLSDPLDWYSMGDLFQLEWRKDGTPSLIQSVRQPIRGINIIEYRFETVVVENKQHPEMIGSKYPNWLLHGLEFALENRVLTIANGLDESETIAKALEGNEFRKTPIFPLVLG